MKKWNDTDAIEKLTGVHAFRKIRTCAYCDGVGVENDGMFLLSERRDAAGRRRRADFVHIRCYYKKNGEKALLEHPELNKVRICDVPLKVMLRVMNAP